MRNWFRRFIANTLGYSIIFALLPTLVRAGAPAGLHLEFHQIKVLSCERLTPSLALEILMPRVRVSSPANKDYRQKNLNDKVPKFLAKRKGALVTTSLLRTRTYFSSRFSKDVRLSPWGNHNPPEDKAFFLFFGDGDHPCKELKRQKKPTLVRYHDYGCDTIPPEGICMFNSSLARIPTSRDQEILSKP